jgi:hypothetical protein
MSVTGESEAVDTGDWGAGFAKATAFEPKLMVNVVKNTVAIWIGFFMKISLEF